MTVSSLSIGYLAAERISKKGSVGHVQSIFRRSFLIFTHDKKLLFIVKKGLSNGPINIMIDLAVNQDVSSMSLKIGDIVMRQKDSLLIGSSLEILLNNAKLWTSSKKLIDVDNITTITKKIDLVKGLAIDRGRHDGLGGLIEYEREIMKGEDVQCISLNIVTTMALPNLKGLVRGILASDLRRVEAYSEALIGLGLGLTPSADDTLAGIMTGLYLFGNNLSMDMSYLLAVNKAVISKLDETKTTSVSKEFLEYAAQGDGVENVIDVVNIILSPSNNSLLNSRVQKLLEMGETSGTDIILGVILGLRIGLELLKRDNSKKIGGLN